MSPSSDSKSATAHPDLDSLLLLQSGELDSSETVALRGHLEICDPCRARVGNIENLFGRVARAGTRTQPSDSDPASSKRNWHLSIGAVAALLISLGAVAALRHGIPSVFDPGPASSTPGLVVPVIPSHIPVEQAVVPVPTVSSTAANPLPAFDPLDQTEANVRLALHRSKLDTSTLLAVDRTNSSVRLWGVVADDATRQALLSALAGLSSMKIALRTEAEEQRNPQPLPWSSFQGDAPPLAADELRALYPTNSSERQQWQNALDRLTRELIGLAKARQGLLALAGKPALEDPAVLHVAAREIEGEMAERTVSVARALAPLIGDRPGETGSGNGTAPSPLHPQSAARLYILVHDLVFLSRASSSDSLGATISQIHNLLRSSSR